MIVDRLIEHALVELEPAQFAVGIQRRIVERGAASRRDRLGGCISHKGPRIVAEPWTKTSKVTSNLLSRSQDCRSVAGPFDYQQ